MSNPYNPHPGGFPAPGAGGGFQPPSAPTSGPVFLPPQQPGGAPLTGVGAETPFTVGGLSEPVVGEPPRRKRSRGKMIGAVVGVAAVLGAGVFAVTKLRSNETSGGASSPEALGTALVDTLNNEDILGAIDLLLPTERDTFRQPLVDLVSELKRLEVFSKDADLGGVSGLDIDIDVPDVDIEETSAKDVVMVSLDADST
ncbi:MAG TPA: hypothetical protein PLV68_09770, partial [Ilumatobacteraceae bacterium]|nr:hypothetical protein [Ilumatobacteraceae bacterium]